MAASRLNDQERIERMRHSIEKQRARKGYDPGAPLDPLKDRNTPKNAALSILVSFLVIAALTLAAALVCAYNTGSAFTLFGFELIRM